MSKEKCKNGCDMLPISNGYCLYCMRMGFSKTSSQSDDVLVTRTDKKPERKKKTIKKISDKRKKEDKIFGQKKLFLELWQESDKRSELSGRDLKFIDLESNLWYCCFAHILNKKNYPKFRVNKDNIMIVHPEEHTLIDAGTEDQRASYKSKHTSTNWDLFYNKQYKLKKQYNEETNIKR